MDTAVADSVHGLVEAAARQWPDAVYAQATEQPSQLTFRQLQQRCRRVAALLAAQGLAPGCSVALVMPNGLGTLQLLLGAMHAGYAVIPVNLLSQPAQMRHVLAHCDASLVLAAPAWVDPVRALGVTGPDGLPLPVQAIDPEDLDDPLLPATGISNPPPAARRPPPAAWRC